MTHRTHRPTSELTAELIASLGKRYLDGAKLGELSRLSGFSSTVLFDRFTRNGYVLTAEEAKRRQGAPNVNGSTHNEAAARRKAHDAEEVWAALNIRFEDAKVPAERGRVYRAPTVVLRETVLTRACG